MNTRWYWTHNMKYVDLHLHLSDAVADAHVACENGTHWVVAQLYNHRTGEFIASYCVIADERAHPSLADALKSHVVNDPEWSLVRAVVSFQQVTSIRTTWYAEEP